jgi:hypothetical protein
MNKPLSSMAKIAIAGFVALLFVIWGVTHSNNQAAEQDDLAVNGVFKIDN